MLVTSIIEVNSREIEQLMQEVLNIAKAVSVNVDDLIIYITNDHNRVREILGMEPVNTEEWPIKYLGDEGGHVVSIIPHGLMKLGDDARRLIIAREIAVIRALNDPLYLTYWVYQGDHEDPLIHRVSLALLRRVVDLIVAESGLTEYVIHGFEKDELRGIVSTCGLERDCAVAALALDAPLSVELAGGMGLGRALWDDTIKGISNEFLKRYDDFRDFVRNNFNTENAYNYLMVLFK